MVVYIHLFIRTRELSNINTWCSFVAMLLTPFFPTQIKFNFAVTLLSSSFYFRPFRLASHLHVSVSVHFILSCWLMFLLIAHIFITSGIPFPILFSFFCILLDLTSSQRGFNLLRNLAKAVVLFLIFLICLAQSFLEILYCALNICFFFF